MEQFEQLLTCAICLDRYRNPKLLPCQHSFCMEPCMDGLVDYVRRQVKCPECRAEHRIPYQGVQAFPTNVTLQRFLELHIEITGELPDPTSGQTMERCGVCSEKSYCSLCVHCEKKCCPECKDAHMDILRREITRINSQIRRGLHRLQDALALVEKNTLGLQTNCASVAEEVDEIYRRLSKALKDRTEHLRNEIERYSGTEIRGLIQLKENLELEIANIQSNCDLADAHINENVPWDDAELLDTKELFLRTVEFIRNFEYEAGDYGRRVRFVMAHEPNQLVLHVAGYGELNIKPETGSGGHLGTTGGLAPPGGSPGLMRSKSDHRLASQYRQQEEDRLARNRYVPDYEYDAPEYEAPRNKSRYRSRFMRHRDGEESDGDTRSTVRFSSTTADANAREKVLDTEDAARGPLSGIFRLTDSPRVMKKLQECERAGKRKKEEPPVPAQPQAPKPQVQVRKAPTAMAKQVSEDDEISRIKKQNKSAPAQVETVEERQPVAPSPVHTPVRETQEREAEETTRRTPIARRTSSEAHTPSARSASSDSSTGSESSAGSGIRSTGAPFTAEEMKQKYLSRAPPTGTTTTVSSGPGITTSSSRESTTTPTSSPRPFQSRFLGAGNRAAPPPPTPAVREEPKKKQEVEDDDDEETTSSSEETESETEEESETEAHPSTPTTATAPTQERQRTESAMARTDIGPLLARSAEARRGSKEDSPSTRYTSPRGSPSLSSPTSTSASSTPGYTSRIVSRDNDVDDDDATSASSASTDRIVEDNVNVLTARDDAGVSVESLSTVDTTVSSDDDTSDSSDSSDSDSESVDTVRATDVPSNDNKNDLKALSNVESRDNASLRELNNNKIDNSYENASAPKKYVKFRINGDADTIESNEEAALNATEKRNVEVEENDANDAYSRQKRIDGNGETSGDRENDERIDDFLARVVRDYNRSREDFAGITETIGSKVENDRVSTIEDSIFDKTQASASTGASGVSKNVKIYEKAQENDVTRSQRTDSADDPDNFSYVASESDSVNSNPRGGGKNEVKSASLDESNGRFLARIEEAEESNDAEENNLKNGENASVKGEIEDNSEASVREPNSDKTDEKSVDIASSDEETTDTETESEETSLRQSSIDGDGATVEKTNDSREVESHKQRNFVTEKVENLFDDNGWVVTDEDAQPGNKHSIVLPNYRSLPNDDRHEETVNPEENDKTDFYNENSTSKTIDSHETKSDSSRSNDLSDDWKKLSSSKIQESNSTIGSNGWLVSEESGSESERTSSPIEAIPSLEVVSLQSDDNSSLNISRMFLSSDEDSLKEELRDNSSRIDTTGSGGGSLGDEQSWVFLSENDVDEGEKGRTGDDTTKEIDENAERDSSSRISGTLPMRESDFAKDTREDNGEASSWNLPRTVDVDDDNDAKHNAGVSQLPRNKAENGVGDVTRRLSNESKDPEEFNGDKAGDNDDDDEAPMNIPMQMVTTVFCVSVLCYSVLTNLFL